MTKEELIYFLDGIAKNYEGVDIHYYRNEANELINKINSEALKKIPNVIDNEVEEKKCEHPYDKIKIDFDNWGVWCHKCNSAL